MSEDIIIEDEQSIRIVRFNRAQKKNALTASMYDDLSDALMRADTRASIGAILIAGQAGIFSAGHDINEFITMASNGTLGESIIRFLKTLATLETPIIAAVDGAAIGIGTTMLFHCDLVVASPESQFQTPFIDLGLVPEAASSLLAPRIMGHVRAFELLCLGAPFDGTMAHQAGFVNRLAPSHQVEPIAREWALALAAKPRNAMRLARSLMRGSRDSILERIDREAKDFAACLTSPEAHRAFEAFLKRR